MLDMVFKQLGRHKARTILTVLGVAIGILLITTLSSFSEGISTTIDEQLTYLAGKITITAEGIGFENIIASELDESLVEELEDFPGIERASPFIAGVVPDVGSVGGVLVDDLDLFEFDIELSEGRLMEEGEDELVLGSNYAERTGLRAGDELEVRGKRYDIVGVWKETGTEDDNGFTTSYEPAQEILRMQDKVSVIILIPVNTDEIEEVADDIADTFDDIQVLSDKDAARSAEDFTGQLSVMTLALGSIAIIIAGLGIMNVMFMSVRERRKEIGVMKALGGHHPQCFGASDHGSDFDDTHRCIHRYRPELWRC